MPTQQRLRPAAQGNVQQIMAFGSISTSIQIWRPLLSHHQTRQQAIHGTQCQRASDHPTTNSPGSIHHIDPSRAAWSSVHQATTTIEIGEPSVPSTARIHRPTPPTIGHDRIRSGQNPTAMAHLKSAWPPDANRKGVPKNPSDRHHMDSNDQHQAGANDQPRSRAGAQSSVPPKAAMSIQSNSSKAWQATTQDAAR
ncbi:hypothetical protein ACLOJK_029712 [Asimina triloba]